jgi:hypothetical protein
VKSPETSTDIDIGVSTQMRHFARWDFHDGRHHIMINLVPHWERAVGIVDRHRGYSILKDARGEPVVCPEKWPAYDTYIDSFIDQINESFLIELVCIERRRQGLRMNYNRCKPCCVARVVAFMADHSALCTRYTRFPQKAPGVA